MHESSVTLEPLKESHDCLGNRGGATDQLSQLVSKLCWRFSFSLFTRGDHVVAVTVMVVAVVVGGGWWWPRTLLSEKWRSESDGLLRNATGR
jgi:hypothetical protein